MGIFLAPETWASEHSGSRRPRGTRPLIKIFEAMRRRDRAAPRGVPKRAAWGVLLFCFGLFGGCRGAGVDDSPQRIILVTIDTLRADHLGSYGYPRNITPFLDSLAARGVLFEKAYSPVSHTAPSHASMFTGLLPQQHQVLMNGESLAPSVRSVAEVMKEQGYTTGAFAAVRFLEGVSQGFDEFRAVGHGDPMPNILAEGRRWLGERSAGEKAFLWLHIYDVHEWAQDDRLSVEDHLWTTTQDPSRAGLWEFLRSQQGIRGVPRKRTVDQVLRLRRWKRPMIMGWHDRYDAQIRWVDRELGLFFDEVEGRFGPGSTTWVVTSDHGEGLGNHGTRTHGSEIYQEQLLVPLIFYSGEEEGSGSCPPDRDARSSSSESRSHAGRSRRREVWTIWVLPLTGKSQVPLLQGEEELAVAPPIFSQRRPPDEKRLELGWPPGEVFALQAGSERILIRTAIEKPEYYDLSGDPYELVDLFDERPEAAERLMAAAWRRWEEIKKDGQVIAVDGGTFDETLREELEALGYL